MSEVRILNFCHKKSILVDIYRQSLLKQKSGLDRGFEPINLKYAAGAVEIWLKVNYSLSCVKV